MDIPEKLMKGASNFFKKVRNVIYRSSSLRIKLTVVGLCNCILLII